MKIFNLQSKHGYQAPLALVGGALGATSAGMTALGATTALGGAMAGASLGSMVGAGTGIGTPKAKKISAPPARSYLGEMQSAIEAQQAIQDRLLSLEGQYTPLYQQLQAQNLANQLQNVGNLYAGAIPFSEQIQAQALESQGRIYGGLGAQALSNYRAGMDTSTLGLYDLMQQQARTGLEAGYGLTPEMERQAQQSARAAMTARGLAMGNQGVAQEVLNSYALGKDRYQTALANAQQAYGLGVNQTTNAYNMYGQPLMNQLSGLSASNILNTSTGLYDKLGTKIFQPESQYNAGIIGANQSNQMQTQLANAQIASAQQSAQMGLTGQIFGAGLKYAGDMGGFSKIFGGSGTSTYNVPNIPYLSSNYTNTLSGIGTSSGGLTNIKFP